MATLNSPGSQVSIVNESFYTPAAPGTVPMIFVATKSNKTNASGTSLAVGTDPRNSGKVYTVGGQQDLTNTFGTPLFYTDASGNPIHGDEQNEYGLQAAYSFTGVSSQAQICRADIDLASLDPVAGEPDGLPANGTKWVDTSQSIWGLFQWNGARGQFGSAISPMLIDDSNSDAFTVGDDITPKSSVGKPGDYAVVATRGNKIQVWLKNTDGVWVLTGSQGENIPSGAVATWTSTVWTTSWPVTSTTVSNPTVPSGTLVINSQSISISSGDSLSVIAGKINQALYNLGVGAKVANGRLSLFADANAKSNGSISDGNILITSTGGVAAAIGLVTGSVLRGPAITIAPHTQYPQYTGFPTGSLYIKTTTPNFGANIVVKTFSSAAGVFSLVKSPIFGDDARAIFSLDQAGGGANIPTGTVYIESNFGHGDGSDGFPAIGQFQVKSFSSNGGLTIVSGSATNAVLNTGTITLVETVPGSVGYYNTSSITVTTSSVESFITQINNSDLIYTSAQRNTDGTVSIIHATAGNIKAADSSGILNSLGMIAGTTPGISAAGQYETDNYNRVISSWSALDYVAQPSQPVARPTDGTIWYNSIATQIDLLWNDGSKWTGYGNAFPGTDPNGPIVAASRPTTQSDGVTALTNGDVWVDTSNLELYGYEVWVYDSTSAKFVRQDTSDSTSPTGWVFADARYSSSGSGTASSPISELRMVNYVDPDCVDPALYPRGTTLWNLRRSGFNVKQYVSNYIDVNDNGGINVRTGESMSGYSTGRWVTISPNTDTGVGSFGRIAQRSVVVKALKATINSNQAIRDTDTLVFNLLACPGYPEVIQNLVALNIDRGLTATVIGDSPLRLPSDPTTLQNWGLNTAGALDNGDRGLVTFDEQLAVFYPSGFTSDNAGNNIVVPASHAMLTTIALSDQKSYPWFAPAGTTRGVVNNISSAGYINSQTGEFVRAPLPQGTRDVMQSIKVNPITTFVNGGIVNFGNLTRANTASALDRINVSRLVSYLRRQLGILSRPYLFEPNDETTRTEIKGAFDSFFLELMGQRAIYDFIVVCDKSNNTPDRIDRSELWIDVAIEPVKAVEFIYIPLRLLNTGAISNG